MSTIETPSINLLDPNFYVDPFAAYTWLRANDPVHWDPVHRIWGVSRYADIVEVEKRTDLYTSIEGSRPATDQRDDTSMINRDDPDHQQQRMLVARQFTPRAVRQIEEELRALVNELIDGFIDDGACEAIESLASPLPAIVIGDKLGFPRELWPKLREWSEITMYESGQNPPDGSPAPFSERSTNAIMEFAGTVMGLIEQRRAEPKDDLISIWANTEVDGRRWSDGEIISECLLLLDGGAETTRTVIARTILNLIENPAELAKLRAGADMTVAVEEFIRYVTPIHNMCRVAADDAVVNGITIPKGNQVVLMYSSANRDEKYFDNGEVLDVTRTPNNHIAFGFGTHFCLGASLARLEIRVFFEELLRRTSGWKLVPGTEPVEMPNAFVRGLESAHVEFDFI